MNYSIVLRCAVPRRYSERCAKRTNSSQAIGSDPALGPDAGNGLPRSEQMSVEREDSCGIGTVSANFRPETVCRNGCERPSKQARSHYLFQWGDGVSSNRLIRAGGPVTVRSIEPVVGFVSGRLVTRSNSTFVAVTVPSTTDPYTSR